MIDNTWILAHPWMTLFLAYLVIEMINSIVVNAFKYLAIWKHGYPPKEN